MIHDSFSKPEQENILLKVERFALKQVLSYIPYLLAALYHNGNVIFTVKRKHCNKGHIISLSQPTQHT